ncbi:hypothetical protein MXB_4805, partial [Myxobolus squamalis]
NGEFIIGSGICNSFESRFTNIWKYKKLACQRQYKPYAVLFKHYSINIFKDMGFAKFTSDNLNIFGINNNLTAKMLNVETAQVLTKFYNKDIMNFPALNFLAINNEDNILLFNGDLLYFSKKKFDLRTTKLLDRIKDLENFIVKNTYNDDILFAIEYTYFCL